MNDPRFNKAKFDPKFRKLKVNSQENDGKPAAIIDERFQKMFDDNSAFSSKTYVDKYGRKSESKTSEPEKAKKNKSEDEDASATVPTKTATKNKEESKSLLKTSNDQKTQNNSKKTQKVAANTKDSKQPQKQTNSDGSSKKATANTPKEVQKKQAQQKKKVTKKVVVEESDSSESEDESGSSDSSSNSDSDSDSDSDSSDTDLSIASYSSDEEGTVWTEMDRNNTPTAPNATRRLALVNYDWENIRAVDIYVAMQSFCPSMGVIQSISVYLSEFGEQRLAEETQYGPRIWDEADKAKQNEAAADKSILDLAETIQQNMKSGGKTIRINENTDMDLEKVRKYELAKLRYYFAVIECDSAATANTIYEACDGNEFLDTGNVFDLRFIPDDKSFSNKSPKDVCTEMPMKYKPPKFHTKALHMSEVELTWDRSEPQRAVLAQNYQNLPSVSEGELRNYLASDTSSDEEEDSESESEQEEQPQRVEKDTLSKASKSSRAQKASKYAALLKEIRQEEEEKNSKKNEMEITFESSLNLNNEDANKLAAIEERIKKKQLEKVKQLAKVQKEETAKAAKKEDKNEHESVWDKRLKKMQEKKKQKAKQKKEEKKLQISSRFSKSKNDGDESDVSAVDSDDEFFNVDFGPEYAKASKSGQKGAAKEEESEEDRIDEEEKKRRDAQIELMMLDHSKPDDNTQSDAKKKLSKRQMRKIKKQKKENVDGGFEVDVADSRFNRLLTDERYSLDPSDPKFKKTKNIQKIVEHRLKTRHDVGKAESSASPAENNASTPATTSSKKSESKGNPGDVDISKIVSNLKRKASSEKVSAQTKKHKK